MARTSRVVYPYIKKKIRLLERVVCLTKRAENSKIRKILHFAFSVKQNAFL